jgi:hypothetical protein
MGNRKLIITWKPDVLSMVDHNGSFKKKAEDNLYPHLKSNNYKGMTARSERESFSNIRTKESAEKIVNRRNKKEILVAKYNNEIIYENVEE